MTMNSDALRFAFVGDVCLASVDLTQDSTSAFPGWVDIKAAIGSYDFLVGNLECCFVDDRCSDAARKQPMATPVYAATFLRTLGFSDLSLANNHMLDCGPEAINVTREHLSAGGIRVFGAGFDLREAEKPAFTYRNGHQIAFLGACDNSEYFAGECGRAGIAPLEKSRLGQRVRLAAAEADIVVVTLHSDLEFSEVPGRWRQRLSRWLIEQGAHLVIQHHPHVLQGIEAYRGGVIAYSLGNFIFRLRGNQYQECHADVFDSGVLVVDADFSRGKPEFIYRLIPVRIGDNHFPHHLEDSSLAGANQRFSALSSLIISNRVEHRRAWLRRCRMEAIHRTFSIYYAIRRGNFKGGAHELWYLLARSENRRWILGLVSLGYL